MSIKLERTQSMLKELLIEAISTLNDNRINNVNVLDVLCSKGKYNAKVFIQADLQNKQEVLGLLKKAEGILKEYILNNSGWFKCPHLQFIIDESLQRASDLDQIFKQINAESDKLESKKCTDKNLIDSTNSIILQKDVND